MKRKEIRKIWSHCGCMLLAMSMVTTAVPVLAATVEETSVEAEESVVEDENGSEQKGLRFDSENSEYAVTTGTFEIPDTLEISLKLDSNENRRQIIMNNYLNSSENSWGIEVTVDNTLRYWENIPGKGKVNCYFTNGDNRIEICTDEWMLISLVRDKENKKLVAYVDGEYAGAISVSQFYDETLTYPMYFGTDLRKTMFLDGTIGEVRMWSDARTAEEIKEYANKTLTGEEEGLAHAWTFSESDNLGPTTTFKDAVKNGIDVVTEGYRLDLPNIELPKADIEVDGSVSFENASSQLAVEDKFTEIPRTFEAVIKLPEDLEGSGGVICGNYMDQGYYNYNLPYVSFEITKDGMPRLYWEKNWSRDDASMDCELDVTVTNVDLRTDEWVHVAMTFDENTDTAICYINGEKVLEVPDCTFTPDIPAQALQIGGDYRTDNDNYFKGEIASVSVWSTVRSEEEIAKDVAGVSEKENGLLGSWSFAATENDVYKELTGSGNDVYSFTDWIEADFAEGDYSFVFLPDTQFLSESYPETFSNMTKWIADNKEKYNIQAALHLGDIVNTNTESQWNNAMAAISNLDNEVSFVPMTGNHDSVSWFKKYVSYKDYAKRDYFGGAMTYGSLEHAYYFFEAGGRRYMVFALGYNPSDDVVDWVNDMIDAEVEKDPDVNVMILTHAYMNWDGTTLADGDWDKAGTNNGDDILNDIAKKHKNVIFCAGGHIGYPDLAVRTDEAEDGHDIVSMLCDAQGMDSQYKGLGMVMMLTFHNDSNEVEVNWYSTAKDKLYRERNQFTIELQHMSVPEVGTVLTTDDATYKVTASGIENGTVEYVKSNDKTATTITIPETVTIDDITYKVTSIASSAFENNRTITEVTIGDNVEKINYRAFSCCINLKKVKIGKNVTAIGYKAFYNCVSIRKLSMPATDVKIGQYAFYGCKYLKEIDYYQNDDLSV